MKVKETTEAQLTSAKRNKVKKPPRIATATAKKTAARAGHVAVSTNAVPHIRKLYTQKLQELAPKIAAILEMTGRKTVKSKDVRFASGSTGLAGILSGVE